jgi:hypothetical protein
MVNTAAYSGLRWGELAALTIPQVESILVDLLHCGSERSNSMNE